MVRTCKTCEQEKPLSEYYVHGGYPSPYCKPCAKAKSTKFRNENIERIRQYDRARSSDPKRMEKNRTVTRAWRQVFPERRSAQMQVQYAIRAGRLSPQPCLMCGAKAVAHHPDYSAPLDVVWLCQPHHKQAHALAL